MKTRIFWVEENLGIMPRPLGGDDLQEEILHWKKLAVDTIVSFLTDDENEELDLEYERTDCRKAGFDFIKFPIPDRDVPDSFLKTKELVQILSDKITDSQKVLLHCRGGIGRVSIITASILSLRGMNTQEAFEKIAKIRGLSVPDTSAQEKWTEEFVIKLKTTLKYEN
jgi:protein-tyrosine phosphatase